ncbi:PREDICTED: metalloprotease TIKI2 [Cercocebus atys]|uniref:metalloprotease TIKI2 n=1 Tax=Cercocebus atys TaxID=9531 RepID=UPI0005F3AA17|nr:PREDICTED: metalloprotease TIKI2 [Cercocebus atys]
MHAALAGPLLAALLATARARPQPPDGGQCRPPGSQRDLNSFLWTIRRDPPAYLFGTIHVPYTRVWDFIPDNSKAAFQASAHVYFELDLTDPYTISALASCQLLPHGENLQDVLPRELYWRLKRHLDYVKLMMPSWMTPAQRGRGLYADYLFNAIAGNWERKRPVWVMLMVNSLTERDVRFRGVPVLDLYLAQQAEKMKKTTGAVEQVEEQCHPLNNGLNFSQVLFALNQTLLQQESVRAGSLQASYTTEDLIKHYNCGDLSAVIFNHDTSQLPNFINTTLPPHEQVTAQEIDSYFRQELIYKRNERMGKRVMALLRENEDKICFFAFGAGLGQCGEGIVCRILGDLLGSPLTFTSLREKSRPRMGQEKPHSGFPAAPSVKYESGKELNTLPGQCGKVWVPSFHFNPVAPGTAWLMLSYARTTVGPGGLVFEQVSLEAEKELPLLPGVESKSCWQSSSILCAGGCLSPSLSSLVVLPAPQSPAPSPEGTSTSPAPVTPAAAVPEAPSVTPTAPPEDEDPALSPHLLLPDSLSQLEEFGRQRKWHKRQSTHQRPRQFNDLWVRIEDSTTASPPPLPLQPTHSSGTAKPLFQPSDQLQQQDLPGPASSSAPTLGLLPAVATTIAARFLLHSLGPS